MIKEWGTVISWQNNVALVKYNVKRWNICSENEICHCCTLNKFGQQTNYIISVSSKQPLIKNQKVELRISEESLLGVALLFYFPPIMGLFLGASFLYTLINTDFSALFGSMLGVIFGFLSSLFFSRKK